MANTALAPYNVSLSPFSPLFIYASQSSSERDTDALLGWNASYTGAAGPDARGAVPSGGTAFRRTQALGAHISFLFEGTGLYLCFTTGGADFSFTLDGALLAHNTTSAANESACAHAEGQADTLLYASGLVYGSHSALLQVSASAEREFRFFGGALEISVGVQTGQGGKVVDDSRIIDDQDSGWVWAPDHWAPTMRERCFNVTATFSCGYGDAHWAAYTFSGAGGAVPLGDVWPDSHAFSVQLDDGEPVNLDATSAWRDGGAAFFVAGALDPSKEYTITLRNFNSDVPDCTRDKPCCTSLDGLQLLRAGKDDSATSSQDPGSDSPGQPAGSEKSPPSKRVNIVAIAGGVTGALVAGALVALLVAFVQRRRMRSREPTRQQRQALQYPQVGSLGAESAGRDNHCSPYMITSSTSASVPGAGMNRDRKQQKGPGGVYHSVSQEQSVAHSAALSTTGSANDGALSPAPGAPRLAQQDLEQVLAFVAQRMDGGRAHVASVHGVDDLPQYRG